MAGVPSPTLAGDSPSFGKAGMSMSYTALVQTYTAQRNPLCRPFEIDRLIHRCFRSDILPDRADYPRFHESEIFGDLYLTRRGWKDRIEEPKTEHPHETLLDALFWDDSFPRRPLCILGMVGAGKSTLIDYYLRCFCPTKGNRNAEFDKKLILHFDARTIRDNTDFYHRFFLFLQSEMRNKCLERGVRPGRGGPPPADPAAKRPPVGACRARGADASSVEVTRDVVNLAVLVRRAGCGQPRSVVDRRADPRDHRGRAMAEDAVDPAVTGHPADVAEHLPQAPESPVQPAPRRPGVRDRADRHPRPARQPRAGLARVPRAPILAGLRRRHRLHRPHDATGARSGSCRGSRRSPTRTSD